MRTRRCKRSSKRVGSVMVGVLLAALTMAPLAGSSVAGAVGGGTELGAHETLTAHATLVCGSVTFNFSPDTPVTYQQIHATGVSCALAKSVIVRGGKWHAKAPAGWTYVAGKFLDEGAGNCGFTWKHGADRITGWIVNPGEGC
jgi:hypothetical protein